MARDAILKGLDDLPKSSDTYLWCDYIELLCITSVDKRFSLGEVIELVNDARDISASFVEDDIDEDSDEDELPAPIDVETDSPQSQDIVEARMARVFPSFAFRKEVFGASYPFFVDPKGREISLKKRLSLPQKLYLQLLLSSSLRYIPEKRRHELTKPFEKVAKVIFSCLLPKGWQVHEFGAASTKRYTGHLYDRLLKLAADLRGELKARRKDFKSRNSGDGGLDLVAWHPLGDERVGIPIALAQCGCSATDWPLKSLEASPSRLRPHLHIHHPWATYYFMPIDLAEADGSSMDWQQRIKLTESITIDRLRLIRMALGYGKAKDCFTAPNAVSEAVAFSRAA